MGSSNPCLTILLVYSALVTIALIVTGSLLGTTHSSVTCAGGDTGVQVTHYSFVDESQDNVEGDGSEEPLANVTASTHANVRRSN